MESMAFPRLAGSEYEDQIAQSIVKYIMEMNVYPSVDYFAGKRREVRCVEFEVLSPFYRKFPARGYPLSGSTTDDGVSGDLIYIERMANLTQERANGSILLINEALHTKAIDRLDIVRPLAVISYSGQIARRYGKEFIFMPRFGTCNLGASSKRDYAAIDIEARDACTLIQKNAEHAKILLKHNIYYYRSQNITIDVVGTHYPDEVILIGSHFDSVADSPGVFDNLSGCLVNLKLLSSLLKKPPRRTVRFCWFGAEEDLHQGSIAYSEANVDELKKLKLMVNIDSVGCALGCDTLYIMMDTPDIEKLICHSDDRTRYIQAQISGDCIPFIQKGIPAVALTREGTLGECLIHQPWDTIENCGMSNNLLDKTAIKILGILSKLI